MEFGAGICGPAADNRLLQKPSPIQCMAPRESYAQNHAPSGPALISDCWKALKSASCNSEGMLMAMFIRLPPLKREFRLVKKKVKTMKQSS